MTGSVSVNGRTLWKASPATKVVYHKFATRRLQCCAGKRGRNSKKYAAPLPAPTGTSLRPAVFRGVEEDHRFEQFFYDDATIERLFKLVKKFEHPLLMCNPTLAVKAEEAGMDYLLLDRDLRFKFLKVRKMAFHLIVWFMYCSWLFRSCFAYAHTEKAEGSQQTLPTQQTQPSCGWENIPQLPNSIVLQGEVKRTSRVLQLCVTMCFEFCRDSEDVSSI